MDIPDIALSVRQPWACCIVHLGKDIENRDWPTRFRGEVAIHASKGMTRDEYEGCLATVHAVSLTQPFGAGGVFPALDELPRGGIVGVARIVDCVEWSASPWFCGRFGFVLADARPVPFVPVRGALGFFRWRERVLA
ncbi:MAG: hypothetical protein KF897_17750 [Opitutaceae bacterium]|nr:hypothetical protein [Opitutaceae bacterium]